MPDVVADSLSIMKFVSVLSFSLLASMAQAKQIKTLKAKTIPLDEVSCS